MFTWERLIQRLNNYVIFVLNKQFIKVKLDIWESRTDLAIDVGYLSDV